MAKENTPLNFTREEMDAVLLPFLEIEEGKALGPAARKRSATVKPSGKYPTGRFPMPDKKHGRLALQMLGRAKGLSSAQKAKIRARANRILGKTGSKKK